MLSDKVSLPENAARLLLISCCDSGNTNLYLEAFT